MNTGNTRADPSSIPTSGSESPVTDRATEKAHQAVDTASEHASRVERSVRHKAADAQDKLGDSKDAAAEHYERSMASVEEFIHEKPLAAAGIAFAAGFLASRIFSK